MEIKPIRAQGAERPGWANSQLPLRNILSYDAQTWWLLVFILKTGSDQVLAKLINQGVAAALLSSRYPKNFEIEKNFLCLKIVEIDMGDNFGLRRTILDTNNSFF